MSNTPKLINVEKELLDVEKELLDKLTQKITHEIDNQILDTLANLKANPKHCYE